MPNKNYIRGRAFEYHIMDLYKNLGDRAYRTAGSHGDYDVIVLGKNKKIRLIQCKTKLTDNKCLYGKEKHEELEPATDGWTVYGIKVTKYIRKRK